MTVSNTNSRVVPIPVADGIATVFPFTFRCDNPGWIAPYIAGVLQEVGVVVALNADQDNAPGGTVTFDAPPAAGAEVDIRRTLPLTQELDLAAYSKFPAEVVEDTFDRTTFQIQQLARGVDDLTARVVVVEEADLGQNTRLDAIEAVNTAQDGRLAALEAQDVADDARMDAIEAGLAAIERPWSVLLSLLGPITQDEVLAQFLMVEAVDLTGGGTAAHVGVAPAVGAEVTVYRNGVVLGTLTWAAGQADAVSTVAGALAPGDLLILSVTAADAAVLDLSITIKGTR